MLQSAFDAHARQVCEDESQIGFVVLLQSVFDMQPTHVSVAVSHTPVGATHAVWCVASHCMHSPLFEPLVSHTGVAPVQSLAVHARQVCDVASQMGVAPLHCAFDAHAGGGPCVMHWPLALS